MKKICKDCGKELDLSYFYKNKLGALGVGSYCKECHRIRTLAWKKNNPERMHNNLKEWRKRNPEKIKEQNSKRWVKASWRKSYYKKNYGLTLEDVDLMLLQQGGMCAICGTTEPGGRGGKRSEKKVFCLDHDHTTGKVRGLLCNRCNKALGLFRDDTEVLRRAISYLELYSQNMKIA